MKTEDIAKKSLIYLIGNLASKVLAAVLVPIYAFYVSAQDLGAYDYIFTLINFCSPLVFFSIWNAILRDLLLSKNQSKTIYSTVMIFSSIMFFIFSIGTLIFSYFSKGHNNIVFYFLLMLFMNSFSQIWQYSARGQGLNSEYLKSSIIGTVINFVFIILFVVFLKLELLGLCLAYALGQFSMIVILEFKIRLLITVNFKEFSWTILKNQISFSLPIALNMIPVWFITGFGRFIISNKLGNIANGIYAFSGKFGSLITILGTVITMALVEESIIDSKNNNSKNYSTIVNNLIEIFMVILILAIPSVKLFYSFISGTEYSDSLYLAFALMAYHTIFTFASNIGAFYQAINKTRVQFLMNCIAAMLSLVLIFLLINSNGLLGVVLAQIIGAIVSFTLLTVYIKKFIVIKFSMLRSSMFILLVIIIAIICYFTNNIISSIILILSISGVLVWKRKLVLSIIQRVKRFEVTK